ncbi:putative Transmembrane protein [Mycena sanguinolenta]|uniref:Putative Transmembrane protein n=1 Tax=Mycena sanguinolenta TaxID=230812 RepID=A0A8H7CKH5_9AGAR|nr:putative Transmembrane protein [Mycena sanguinolenta]
MVSDVPYTTSGSALSLTTAQLIVLGPARLRRARRRVTRMSEAGHVSFLCFVVGLSWLWLGASTLLAWYPSRTLTRFTTSARHSRAPPSATPSQDHVTTTTNTAPPSQASIRSCTRAVAAEGVESAHGHVFDLNAMLTVVQCALRHMEYSPAGGKNWSLVAAAYTLCWALRLVGVVLLYEGVYCFVRPWREHSGADDVPVALRDILESSSTTPSSTSTTKTTHATIQIPARVRPATDPVLVHPIVILDFSFFPAAFSPSSPVPNGARPPLEGGAAARAAGRAVAGAAAIRARAKGRLIVLVSGRAPTLLRLLWRDEDQSEGQAGGLPRSCVRAGDGSFPVLDP